MNEIVVIGYELETCSQQMDLSPQAADQLLSFAVLSLAFSSGRGGLASCAVLSLFEHIEVVSKSEGAVHAPAFHTRAAHAGGFEIHDAVTPLQRARLWRVAVLFEHGLKKSVCTRFGWYLVLGELGEIGLTEIGLVEV